MMQWGNVIMDVLTFTEHSLIFSAHREHTGLKRLTLIEAKDALLCKKHRKREILNFYW